MLESWNMKKLLAIVILGFLTKDFFYTDVAYANQIPDMTNSIWKVKTFRKETITFEPGGTCSMRYRDIIMRTSKDCTWKQEGNLVTLTGNDNYWTKKLTVTGMRAKAIFTNINGFTKSGTGSAEFVENWLTASSNTSTVNSSNNKIAQSKKICKELGFKANSEKFADCALKMMAMQFETGNKVSNNDGSSTQQIIVKQQDDFDVGDFFFGLQKIVDDNYRSSNNNSSNQGTNCRIVPKAWGADMVCR